MSSPIHTGPHTCPKSTRQTTSVDLESLVKQVSTIVVKAGLTYEDTRTLIAKVRAKCNLKPRRTRITTLPVLPSSEDIATLLSAAEQNHTHWTMIQTLIGTGCRVSELINIQVGDVYYQEKKIFIRAGKTGDRYVLFPDQLSIHFKTLSKDKRSEQSLFISRQNKKYTRFGVGKMLKDYTKGCGITKRIHPHIFRHLFCTRLSTVMNESEVMTLSGHASKDTLAIYQHLSIADLQEKYRSIF